MPLTKTGKRALRNFKKEYGKKKGKSVFYAYMNEHPRKTKGWHNPNSKRGLASASKRTRKRVARMGGKASSAME